MSGRAVGVLIALGAVGADAAPAAKPLAPLLHALDALSLGSGGRTLCPRISELEAAWGPLHYQPKPDAMANLMPLPLPLAAGMTSASAQLVFDIYHHDPSKDTDPTVGSVAIAIDDRELATIDALFADPAATRAVIAGSDIYSLHDLYFRKQTRELVLSCGQVPVWAQAPWTAGGATAYGKAFGAFVAAPTPASWAVLVTPAVATTRDATSFSIRFKTPLPGTALLTAIGATKVILTSTDVHMSHFQLAHVDGSPIVVHGWTLDIAIDDTGITRTAAGAVSRSAPLPLAGIRLIGISGNR